MKVVLEHIRRNVVGYIALFVALGGTGYAAATIPQASVGSRQIKNHAIDPIKLNPKFINGNVRAWAVVSSSGRVLAGGGKPEGAQTVTRRRVRRSVGECDLKPNCANDRHDRLRTFVRRLRTSRFRVSPSSSAYGGICSRGDL